PTVTSPRPGSPRGAFRVVVLLSLVDSAQCKPAFEEAAGVDDSAAARLGVSTGHHVLRRLPARNRSMHTRISALKARSGVLIGQPYDSGLSTLYSAMQLDSGGGLVGCGSPASEGGGRLRRSSPSLGDGGKGGTLHSKLEAVLLFLGSQALLAIALIASPIWRPSAPPAVSFGGGKYFSKRVALYCIRLLSCCMIWRSSAGLPVWPWRLLLHKSPSWAAAAPRSRWRPERPRRPPSQVSLHDPARPSRHDAASRASRGERGEPRPAAAAPAGAAWRAACWNDRSDARPAPDRYRSAPPSDAAAWAASRTTAPARTARAVPGPKPARVPAAASDPGPLAFRCLTMPGSALDPLPADV